uniref:CSON006714 protein n=1 Tax=Culicoides sonorensis TaxID=179676 RepID=A0A336LWH2_CULSO
MDIWNNIVSNDQDYYNDDLEAFALIESELESSQSQEMKRKKRQIHINRNFEEFDKVLFDDYFSANPRYPLNVFKRSFRKSHEMFVKIANELTNFDSYFKLRFDATRKKGLSTYQKLTAALRSLAYGNAADSIDEYILMLCMVNYICDHLILMM